MITPTFDNKVLVVSGLIVHNPPDLTDTWDRVRVYASGSSSTNDYTLSACTAEIVTTNTSVDSPGYTPLAWSAAGNSIDSTFWFKAMYYDAAAVEPNSAQSSRTLLATKTRLEDQIALKLRDTTNTVWTSTEVRDYAEKSLNALRPHLFMEATDSTSLDTVANQREYTLPGGWFKINQLFIGDVGSTYREYSDYQVVGKRTLVLGSEPTQAENITIYGHRWYQHSWEVPLIFEDIMLYYALFLAYQALETDRGKFKQYAQLVKDKDLRVPEIVAMANTYLGRYKDRISELVDWSPTEMTLA